MEPEQAENTPSSSSSIRILSNQDVSTILNQIPVTDIIQSQAKVFATFSQSHSQDQNQTTPDSHSGRRVDGNTNSGNNASSGPPIPIPPKVQNPARLTIQTNSHKMLFMPSRIELPSSSSIDNSQAHPSSTTTSSNCNPTSASTSAPTAIKIASVPTHPEAPPGLPATSLIFDEITGKTQGVINATDLTALRTAAGSALAVDIFASSSVKRLAIFGGGLQALYHARLILSIRPSLNHLTLVNRSSNQRLNSIRDELIRSFPNLDKVEILISSPKELDGNENEDEKLRRVQVETAVKDANVICTCTPSLHPLFAATSLSPGTTITSIGSYTPQMLELPLPLITSLASHKHRIVVDSIEACLEEAGEIIQAAEKLRNDQGGLGSGSIESIIPMIELGSLLTTTSSSASSPTLTTTPNESTLSTVFGPTGSIEREGGINIFKSVGIGAQDSSISKLVFDKGVEMGIGKVVGF